DEQEADALLTRLHDDFVTAIEQHQRTVPHRIVLASRSATDAVGLYRTRCGCITERAGALEDVGEGMARRFDRQHTAPAGWHPHVEVSRIRSDAFNGALLSPELAAHDAH